jgi:hypothetical protein
MNAIKTFAAWAWDRIVVLTKALNDALATPAPLETDGFAHHRDDTVFQPRDY